MYTEIYTEMWVVLIFKSIQQVENFYSSTKQ